MPPKQQNGKNMSQNILHIQFKQVHTSSKKHFFRRRYFLDIQKTTFLYTKSNTHKKNFLIITRSH